MEKIQDLNSRGSGYKVTPPSPCKMTITVLILFLRNQTSKSTYIPLHLWHAHIPSYKIFFILFTIFLSLDAVLPVPTNKPGNVHDKVIRTRTNQAHLINVRDMQWVLYLSVLGFLIYEAISSSADVCHCLSLAFFEGFCLSHCKHLFFHYFIPQHWKYLGPYAS